MPKLDQTAVNDLFAAARERARSNPNMRVALQKDDVIRFAHRSAVLAEIPRPSGAAMQRGWKWALETGVVRKNGVVLTRRGFPIPCYRFAL